jgi:uncharacterized membrane protein required for colicin V production
MEILNRNHISFQEIDGLIRLAEEVSVNIEILKNKIKINYAYTIMYTLSTLLITVLVFSGMLEQFLNTVFKDIVSEIISKLLGSILTGLFISQALFKFQGILKMKSTIIREQKVIHKLLNMIEGYKDLYIENEYGTESSVLSKALFEMRLSRINFGVK